MSSLTAFLLAQLAEDESVARDMAHQAAFGRPLLTINGGGTGIRRLVDPARTLAHVQAVRAAIDAAWADHLRIEGEWGLCRGRSELDACGEYPDVVLALAQPYTGVDGWDDAWKVEP